MLAPSLTALAMLACAPGDAEPGFGFTSTSATEFEGVAIPLDHDLVDLYASSSGPTDEQSGWDYHFYLDDYSIVSGFVNFHDFEIKRGRLVLWSPMQPGRTMSVPGTVDDDDRGHFEVYCDDASELDLDLAVDPVVAVIVVELIDGRVPRPTMPYYVHWPVGENGLDAFFSETTVSGDRMTAEIWGNGGDYADILVLDPWEGTLAGPFPVEANPIPTEFETLYDDSWQAILDLPAVAVSSPEQLWPMMRLFDSDDVLHGVVGIDPSSFHPVPAF